MAHPVRPLALCGDCGQLLRHYAKGLCINCYQYQRAHGTRRFAARHSKLHGRFCEICLTRFDPRWARTRFCSKECWGLYLHYQAFRGQVADCQRCGRYRKIRSKKLCGSCYVMARWEMVALGLPGVCPSRIQRLALPPSSPSPAVV